MPSTLKLSWLLRPSKFAFVPGMTGFGLCRCTAGSPAKGRLATVGPLSGRMSPTFGPAALVDARAAARARTTSRNGAVRSNAAALVKVGLSSVSRGSAAAGRAGLSSGARITAVPSTAIRRSCRLDVR